MTTRAQILFYAPKARAHEFLELGWIAHPKTLNGTHHGEFSIVMEWLGDDDPIMPESRSHCSKTGD
jgi:hypothetical protein